MVGARARWVKVALVFLLVAGCAGRAARHMATHVDVLLVIARKGTDLVVHGRLTAESMPELTYPLERAEAFARTAAGRAREAPPASLVAFRALIVRYREFLDALDRARRERTGAPALAGPLAAVEAAGEAVREALRREGAG